MFFWRQDALGVQLKGQTNKTAIALKVVRGKRRLGVGQELPVLEDGRAQDLLRGETRSPVTGLGVVTQIV